MEQKSKILILGGTGYIGKYVVEASANSGHPTFVLVRNSTISSKPSIIQKFKNLGVTIIKGDMDQHEILLKTIKQVDVVISIVGLSNIVLADQVKIIAAIKEAGNIKRFLPSEFGFDRDRHHAVEPAKAMYETKAQIRRAAEASGVPYTYIICNLFAGYFLANLYLKILLRLLLGTKSSFWGTVLLKVKVVFNKEEDIGTYTIKAVDNPRTLNKSLYINPPANIMSMNELVSLWEKKIGKTLEKVYIKEDQVLKNIQDAGPSQNLLLAILHSAYVKGDMTSFDIDPSFGVEASELYPDVRYTTVDAYLNQFV